MKKVFLDTNILIDLVDNRDLDITGIDKIFDQSPYPRIYISALSVPLTFYACKIKNGGLKYMKLKKILDSMDILPLTDNIIFNALEYSNTPDYEDTLQYITAIESDCNYILTRDMIDFSKIEKVIPSKTKVIYHISQMNQ